MAQNNPNNPQGENRPQDAGRRQEQQQDDRQPARNEEQQQQRAKDEGREDRNR